MYEIQITPNPSFTQLRVEITCNDNQTAIVYILDANGRFVSIFYWQLIKGKNITAMNELGQIKESICQVGIVDQYCRKLYSTQLKKEITNAVAYV